VSGGGAALDLRGERAIPPEVFARGGELLRLVAAEMRLRSLPRDVERLTALTTLDVAHNLLRDVPPLPAGLRILYLGDNAFAAVPEAIRALGALEYLGIDDNLLTALPEWLGELSSLVELRVQGNAIGSLPSSLGELKALRELHTRGNGLLRLPESIGALSSLRHLDLRDNALTTLPPLESLSALDVLDLRANPLRDLPPLPANLKKLDLRWTPFFPDLPGAALAARDRGAVVLN
jgi:Leucine-rich repeat (LRR) protein